jgi:hypothetical protein
MPEITIFADSAQGLNKSADGSSFTYVANPPISIPRDANPVATVTEANLFYTSPNVGPSFSNNTLRFALITSGSVTAGNAVLDEHILTFDTGLYSLADLQEELSAFTNLKQIPDDCLSLVGHSPTQTVEIQFDVQGTGYGVIIYLSDANSIGSLLGFTATDLVYDRNSFAAADITEMAHFRGSLAAKFDAIQLFLLRASIVSGSMSYDATGDPSGNVLAALTPDVSPGSMILYRPIHPSRIACDQMKGARTSSIRFSLTDNNGAAVTISEAYTFRLVISW